MGETCKKEIHEPKFTQGNLQMLFAVSKKTTINYLYLFLLENFNRRGQQKIIVLAQKID